MSVFVCCPGFSPSCKPCRQVRLKLVGCKSATEIHLKLPKGGSYLGNVWSIETNGIRQLIEFLLWISYYLIDFLLPVEYQIYFKVSVLTFKALNGQALTYLLDSLSGYTPRRALHSNDQNLLVVPGLRDVLLLSMRPRCFYALAHTWWNFVNNQMGGGRSMPRQLVSSCSWHACCRHPHVPALQCAARDPGHSQGGQLCEWEGVGLDCSILHPDGEWSGPGLHLLESPTKRQMPFWTRLSTVWSGPGRPAAKTGVRWAVCGRPEAAHHQNS